MMNEGFSSPLSAQSYGPPPYPVEDAKFVVVRYVADPEAIAAIIPDPLRPVGDGVLTAFIGDMWQSRGPGAYHEGGLVVPVKYKDRTSSYCPFLWTSTDEALLVGREVFGLPKQLCDPTTMWADGNARRGNLLRRGDELLAVGVNLEERADAIHMLPHDRYFVKKVPSPDPNWPPLRQLIHQQLTEHQLRFSAKGQGWVRVGANAYIDLTALAPVRVIEGWYIEASWNVPWAKVVEEQPREMSHRAKEDGSAWPVPASPKRHDRV